MILKKYKIIDPLDLATIPQRIEGVRLFKQLTLGQMCEIMDASRYLYNQTQKNKYPPQLKWLVNISEKLNVSFNWLRTGKGRIYKDNSI